MFKDFSIVKNWLISQKTSLYMQHMYLCFFYRVEVVHDIRIIMLASQFHTSTFFWRIINEFFLNSLHEFNSSVHDHNVIRLHRLCDTANGMSMETVSKWDTVN